MAFDSSYLNLTLDHLDEPLFILGEKNACVYANRAFCDLVKADSLEMIGDPSKSFWPDLKNVNLKNPEITCEINRIGGVPVFVNLKLTSLCKELKLVRVISSWSKSETLSSFHTQRLETLGMLAGGIAHDFNNILTGILGHVSYLNTILPEYGEHKESLSSVEEGARKASGMIQQILNFSKLEGSEVSQIVELGELVIKISRLMKGAVSSNCQLEVDISDEFHWVLGSEAKLAQIVANLIINARDAVRNQGSIKVTLREVKDTQELGRVFKGSDLASAYYVVLSVQDDGCGISPEIIGKVFEPYFSTKQEKGTGLGLSTVDAIVRLFGGTISIDSEVNRGTEVRVYLPMVEPQEKVSTLGEPGEMPTGSESILVIDDEYPVRNVLNISLQHLGYDVEVAASGNDGVAKFGQSEKEYDLVILDMIMPDLSGDEVFFQLKKLNPAVKVLVISGYAAQESIDRILDNGGMGFMQKPFTIEELSRYVRTTIDAVQG